MTMPAALQNLSLPVIASPMFIASGPALVAAQCKAGIVGSFPALNARPAETARHLADRPAGANWPTTRPPIRTRRSARSPSTRSCTSRTTAWRMTSKCASSTRYRSSSPRCARRRRRCSTPSTATAASCCTTSSRSATPKKALEAGVDGLILVAAGAGGHAGALSPFALVGEVRKFFKGPIALSGSIATGDADPGRAGDGRRLCLHRLALAGDEGIERQRRLPRRDRRIDARPTSSTRTCLRACTAIT